MLMNVWGAYANVDFKDISFNGALKKAKDSAATYFGKNGSPEILFDPEVATESFPGKPDCNFR